MVKSMNKMDVGFERVLAMVGRKVRSVLEKKLMFNLCKVYHYGFESFVYRIEKGENFYFFLFVKGENINIAVPTTKYQHTQLTE